MKKKITLVPLVSILWLLMCVMPSASTFAKADDRATIYGSVIYSASLDESQLGLYSFNTVDGAVFTPIKISPNIVAQGGGVYANGKYYAISQKNKTLCIYDADTWEELESRPMSIFSLDMTYDPSTDKIYGCFIDGGIKLGILLPEEGSYQFVADLSTPLSVMVCSMDGKLFGIGVDGVLYSINKETAELTFIGETGFFPMYVQSATIDPNTGKCYWVAVQEDRSGLYEVSLETGAITLITQYFNAEEITGLFILPEVVDGVPAKVADLQINFLNGSNKGNVSFTIPSQTHGGNVLSGSLVYKLQINDEVKTGTVKAGEKVTCNYDLTTGKYKFALTVSNATGESEKAIVSRWIGFDAPAAVSDLVLEKKSKSNITVSWKAPTEGIHQGYVDASTLSYEIVRYPGNIVIEENYKGTSLSEEITTDKLAKYWYVITPVADNLVGEKLSSNKMIMGPGKEIPYNEDFSTTTAFNLFTIIDANNDNDTWYQEVSSETAQYLGNNTPKVADDWLVTTPIQLTEKGFYKLRFRVKCNSYFSHQLEVGLGEFPTVEDIKVELLPVTKVTAPYEFQTLEAKFYVTKASDYYIGFHLVSDPLINSLDIDDISVELISSVHAPTIVSDLKIQPGEKGVLKAGISFQTPTKTINGESLSTLTKVELYREDDLIKEFMSPQLGALLSFEDNSPVNGFNTYKIIAYNEKGTGNDLSQKVYVGIDIPAEVRNITVDEPEDGIVALTWEAPVIGINGGYINPSKLTYSVKRNGWFEVEQKEGELSATDQITDLNGVQRTTGYILNAISEAGTGPDTYSPYISAGIPYETPFKESFASGNSSYTEWTTLPPEGNSAWRVLPYQNGEPQDDDQGMIALLNSSSNPMEARLMSPKIRIDNLEKPIIEFWVYHSQIKDELCIEIYDSQRISTVMKRIDLKQNTNEWIKYQIDLSAYKNHTFFQISFLTQNVLSDDILYIDHIQAKDDLDYNLSAIEINGPRKMKVGEEREVSVTVANIGKKQVSRYSVNFYNGEELIKTVDGVGVEPDRQVVISMKWIPKVTNLNEMSIHAVIDYSADQNQRNNVTKEMDIKIVPLTYPVVTNLSSSSTDKEIVLSWSAPDISNLPPAVFIESFENYDSFTVSNFGDWTMIDEDKNKHSMEFQTSENEWITYPNSAGPMAYQIIDLTQINGTSKDGWNSVSGNKILICPYSIGGTNDWIISPELYSMEQTITINAKSLNYNQYGLENLTILYSTSNKEITSFQELRTENRIPTEWNEYTFELPKEANYFAIQAKKINAALFLDDISYIPATATPEKLSIIGYNIYKNGKKLNQQPITELCYIDSEVEKGINYEYKVTVVYDKGESNYSDPVLGSLPVGIQDNNINKTTVYVESHVIRVANANQQEILISTIDGRIIYRISGEEEISIPLSAGCYIVNVNNTATKVIVP